MTLDQWRQNKGLVKWLAKTLSGPEGQELLKMLDEIHVRHIQDPDPAGAQIQLGRIFGYDLVINNLVHACQLGDKPKELGQATFPSEED